jgi:hypothetical protein
MGQHDHEPVGGREPEKPQRPVRDLGRQVAAEQHAEDRRAQPAMRPDQLARPFQLEREQRRGMGEQRW